MSTSLFTVFSEDVEAALANAPLFFWNLPGRSATHVLIGRDGQGRVLYVPILRALEPDVWLAVSAWESRFARRLYRDPKERWS